MFKVGKVSYLNTVPLFYRFEDPMIELVEGGAILFGFLC
jgi:hypothetical protein